jgi:hypothetical protein
MYLGGMARGLRRANDIPFHFLFLPGSECPFSLLEASVLRMRVHPSALRIHFTS